MRPFKGAFNFTFYVSRKYHNLQSKLYHICRRQISSRFWTESVLPECREVQLLRFSEGKWRREPTSKSCNLPKASTRSCHPAPEGRKHINTSPTNLSDKGTLPQPLAGEVSPYSITISSISCDNSSEQGRYCFIRPAVIISI